MRPTGPAALLASARDRDPARPLLTHYDDATGEWVPAADAAEYPELDEESA